MAGPLSKRQQARNERTLQELIRGVPGNNTCADCGARNPGWASWSLGVFLCMRCAGLHRKLGTHISKVKSLSMDSWTNEHVENMKKTGNVTSNRVYNPDNTKPPIPFDVDEADSAMERFIRQKYQHGTMQAGRAPAPRRHDTGSTESDDNPPPLPPKAGSKFGFRSASSIFPMSSKAKREAAARANFEAERIAQQSPTSPPRNKPSRVFGAAVSADRSTPEDLDSKLATLHQMGFPDEKANTAVLREVGGSLAKAVETLVKSGSSAPASRARTPLSITAGITIQHSPRGSNNPFDLPSPLPIQSSQSTGNVPNQKVREVTRANGNNLVNTHPSNPFGLAPSQSQYSLHQQYLLEQSLQNMTIGGQSQTLFPNRTGDIPQNKPFQAAPSRMPTIPQNNASGVFDAQPQQQHQQSNLQSNLQNQNYNPFLQQQAPQTQVPNQTMYQVPSANPYVLQGRAQTYPQALSFDQPHQQQQAYYDTNQLPQNPQGQQPLQLIPQINNNPYGFAQQNQQQQQQQQQSAFMQLQNQQQQLLPQQTGRADKSSILALYNYPQLAPQLSQPQPSASLSQDQNVDNQGFPTIPAESQQQRSVSNPYTSTSRNPFMNLAQTGASMGNGNGNGHIGQGSNGMSSINGTGVEQHRHVSQESMSVDVGGWHGQNGRHSPDAFANLSARSMR